jgi:hypothetical protein
VKQPVAARDLLRARSRSSSARCKTARSSSTSSSSSGSSPTPSSSRSTSTTTSTRWAPCSTTACAGSSKKMAVFILGGGVPKNYTLQGEPLLDRSSGCPPTASTSTCSSASTRWTTARSRRARRAKATPGARSRPRASPARVYCHADVTAVFPWVTYALLSTQARPPAPTSLRPPREALALLDEAVLKNRESLLQTISSDALDQAVKKS